MVNLAPDKENSKEEEHAPKKTGGEHAFNFTSWFLFGWIINSLSGVATAEYANNRPGSWAYGAKRWAQEHAANIYEWVNNKISPKDIQELQKIFLKRVSQVDLPDEVVKQFIKDGVFNAKGEHNQAFYDLFQQEGGFKEVADKLGKGFSAENIEQLRNHMLRQETGRDTIATLATLLALCAGGFIVMVPIKLMEDNKRPMVEWLDKHVVDPFKQITGQAPATAMEKERLEEQRKERYDYFSQTEKQTWASVLKSRLVGLIPIYVFHLSMGGKNNIVKLGQEKITGDYVNPDPNVGFGGVGHMAEQFGNWAGASAHNITPDSAKQHIANQWVTDEFRNNHSLPAGGDHSKRWMQEKLEWLAIDVGYSFFATVFTFGLSRIFGKKSDDNQQVETANNITPVKGELSSKRAHMASVGSQAASRIYEKTPTTSLHMAEHAGAVETAPERLRESL